MDFRHADDDPPGTFHPSSSSSSPPQPPPPPPVASSNGDPQPSAHLLPRYFQCLRNHAAALGGHVVDGCGEFMPAPSDPLKCAACDCHRSFHRRDWPPSPSTPAPAPSSPAAAARGAGLPLLLPPPYPTYKPHAGQQQLHFQYHHHHHAPIVPPSASGGSSGTTVESSSEELPPPLPPHAAAARSASVPASGTTPQPTRKRHRTKFTAEQKERLQEFAERIGWRIQRQDEAAVAEFCAQVGVKRQVLKVWMHNHKHGGAGGAHTASQSPPMATLPPVPPQSES